MIKCFVTLFLCCAFLGTVSGQIDKWTTVRFGTLQCDFPKDYSPIQFTGASGVYFDGGNIYLTVTNQPDTSKMRGNLNRDYTRDFMNVVLDVSRKLNGKVREFRDTVIGNMPGYISKIEASFKGQNSYYELIQVIGQDSLRSFSSQYSVDNAQAIKATQRFFNSIRVSSKPSAKRGLGKLGIWAGALVVVAVLTLFVAKRARQPHKKHNSGNKGSVRKKK